MTPGLGIPCSILLSYGRDPIGLYGRPVPTGKARAGRRAILAGVLATAFAEAARAGERAAVAAVDGPDRLRLADGRIVRLVGVVVPGDLSPAPDGHARMAAARARLETLLGAGPVDLEPLGLDRYGRIEALVRAADGRLLQAELVEAGLGWAWPDGLPRPTARALLEIEASARAAGRGLWAVPQLADQPAGRVETEPPRFAVVVGRVETVGRSGGFTWLNFGPDRGRDFTVRIPASALRELRRAKLDPDRLAGRRVRVRGWLFASGGAMIEVEDALQIEVLE